MFGLGTWEMIILLVIVVLLFGAKRIPKLAKSMGESIKAFRSGTGEDVEGQLAGKED
jgi:sec-independent protein translocase protein TatA